MFSGSLGWEKEEGLNSLGTTLWVFFNAECKFWETNTQKFAPIMLKIIIRL